MTIQKMTRISIFASLICICTVIIPPIPIFGIPVTLQTLMVMLTAILLTPTEALLACLIYVLLGIAGLPVFSGLKSGFDVVLGPTGGFIVSFPFAAFLISYFKGNQSTFNLIVANIIFGVIFVYIIGIAFLAYFNSISILKATEAMLVFIPIDLGKVFIASFAGTKINKARNSNTV